MTARSYTFSSFCAWGLTGSSAALGLVGVLGMFTPNGQILGLDRTGWCVIAFAAVMAFAILQVNNMAEAAMHAIDRPGGFRRWHWPTLVPAIICAAGFAVGANIGAHLGWQILRASAVHPEDLPSSATMDLIFLFLSCAKPLSMLAVAGRKAMDEARIAAQEELEAARREADKAADRANRHVENLARIGKDGSPAPEASRSTSEPVSQGEPVSRSPRKRLKLVENIGSVAALGGLALMGAGEPAHALPSSASEPPATEPASRAQPVAAVGSAQRAEARSLIAQGVGPAEVSRRTGVSLSSCKRDRAAFLAGRLAA